MTCEICLMCLLCIANVKSFRNLSVVRTKAKDNQESDCVGINNLLTGEVKKSYSGLLFMT